MMSWYDDFSADQFEDAIGRAIGDKDLKAAVSLLRTMAVAHPFRCEALLNGIEATLDVLKAESVGESE